eukprot:16443550-Heterocapsa_arctica.AAC.1
MGRDVPPEATGSNVGSLAPLIPDPAGTGPRRNRPWSVPVSKEIPSSSNLVRQGRWGNVLAPPPLTEALWVGAGAGKHGLRAAPGKIDKEQQNCEFPGGMRNPTRAVSRLPRLRGLGKRLADEFDTFAKTHDEVWQLAEGFGTEGYEGPSCEL